MMGELAGAATILVVVLAYVLIVQAMMAAVVLLAQFIVVQVQTLRTAMAHTRAPSPMVERPSYRVGGGLMKWE